MCCRENKINKIWNKLWYYTSCKRMRANVSTIYQNHATKLYICILKIVTKQTGKLNCVLKSGYSWCKMVSAIAYLFVSQWIGHHSWLLETTQIFRYFVQYYLINSIWIELNERIFHCNCIFTSRISGYTQKNMTNGCPIYSDSTIFTTYNVIMYLN